MEENGRAYLVIPAKAGIYRAMGTGLRRCDEDGSLVRQRLFSWEARRSRRFFNKMGVAYSRGSGEQQILSNPIISSPGLRGDRGPWTVVANTPVPPTMLLTKSG